jgi:hypothetical protein
MNILNDFEIEVLEPRLEFVAQAGFWATLWDCVCWIAESTWDIMQTVWDTSGIGGGYNIANNNVTLNVSFSGFFHTLGNYWSETWTKYWM